MGSFWHSSSYVYFCAFLKKDTPWFVRATNAGKQRLSCLEGHTLTTEQCTLPGDYYLAHGEIKLMTLVSLTAHLDHLGTVGSWPPCCALQRGKDASLTEGLAHVITLGKFWLRHRAPPDTLQAESCKHSTKRKYYKSHLSFWNRAHHVETNFRSASPLKQKKNRAQFTVSP